MLKSLCILLFFCHLAIADDTEKKPYPQSKGNWSAFNPFNPMGPPISLLSYEGRIGFGDSAPSFSENKLQLSAPIYKSENETVSGSLTGAAFHISDDLRLDTGIAVPSD